MKNIDEIFLPLGSNNENLETLSRKKFIQLFDEERFIIKDEIIDNGIDFRGELIKNYNKLGFNFIFQLKSKIDALSNADGSYSKSIDTSNIEYLINNGQSAFYGFYVKNEDKIYYENLNDFIKSLHEKSIDWENQPSHTLRFTKVLDTKAKEIVYKTTLEHGKLLRALTYKLAIKSAINERDDKITIDFDKNVTSDSDIRYMTENIGFDLINEARWKDIISMHKRGTGAVASTAKYNMILGIANYYNGNILEAVSFFKNAIRNIYELPTDLNQHLKYFDSVSRYAIGMLSRKEYDVKMSEFQNVDNINLYVMLERAKFNYLSNLEADADISTIGNAYEMVISDLNAIINNPKANDNVKLLARCELLLIEGHKINLNYVQRVALVNALEEATDLNMDIRIASVHELYDDKSKWSEDAKLLQDEASKNKNFFAFFNSMINEIKVTYEFDVFITIIKVHKTPTNHSVPELSSKEHFLRNRVINLKRIRDYYNSVGHVENVIATLSLEYEVEHYLENYEEAKLLLSQLDSVVSTVDPAEYRRKFEFLKNKGTTHERFEEIINNIFDKSDRQKKEADELTAEMMMMDELEKEKEEKIIDPLHIDLFPISYFKFPANSIHEVLLIINCEESVKENFTAMYEERIIPIANIYNISIKKEGYAGGHRDNKGIESLRNIYRVRKAFFEKNFYRAYLNISSANDIGLGE